MMSLPIRHASVFADVPSSIRKALALTVLIFFILSGVAAAAAYQYHIASAGKSFKDEKNVVGFIQYHTLQKGDTFLSVARHYDLGYDEMTIANPNINPRAPGVGKQLVIPTCWILPPAGNAQVVINIPEFRLYRFYKKIGLVITYPIGIGMEGSETNPAVYRVVDKQVNPTWYPPRSCWAGYGKAPIPPGPDNPLGNYWIGLSTSDIGIHGTIDARGIGMPVSHGCIRLYAQDITKLFREVSTGNVVNIIYAPVEIGVSNDTIYLEVYPDIYKKIPNLFQYTENLIRKKGLWKYIDEEKVVECVKEEDGIPSPIGRIQKGVSAAGNVGTAVRQNSGSIIEQLAEQGVAPAMIIRLLVGNHVSMNRFFSVCQHLLNNGNSKVGLMKMLYHAGADRNMIAQTARHFDIPPPAVTEAYRETHGTGRFGYVYNPSSPQPQPPLTVIGVFHMPGNNGYHRSVISPSRP